MRKLIVSCLFFVLAAYGFGAVTVAKNDDGSVAPARGAVGDPRLMAVADADHAAMQPYQDARGCPRWTLSGGRISFIALKDRAAPRDAVRRAWANLAGWKARAVDPALLTDVDLKAYYDSELARYQASYEELTRAGVAADDPVPPAKTTITPQ